MTIIDSYFFWLTIPTNHVIGNPITWYHPIQSSVLSIWPTRWLALRIVSWLVLPIPIWIVL